MAQFCAAATGPPGRLAWSIIPPPLTRVKALGTQVMGSRTLLRQLATASGPKEPIGTGHSHDSADDAGRDHRVNRDLPTTPTDEPRNRERL